MHDSSIYMYADDTLLVCESDNIDSVTMKTGLAFESMQKWCNANKLSINFTKTKYMVIKHTKVPNEPTLIVEKNNINTVNQYEYLGMVLDDKLTMNKYILILSGKRLTLNLEFWQKSVDLFRKKQ